MGPPGLGAGDQWPCQGQVNHLSTCAGLWEHAGDKMQPPPSDGLLSSVETDKEPGLTWEHLGSPGLVLGVREGFLGKVVARLKPGGGTGFMLLRVGKGSSRQIEWAREQR